ncbi:MAG: secretion protein EspB [Actinomycetota bacterium]|uniref:Secretion protein EspB n=1 Tax=Mycobacterium lentiflavum TaxID=141349 RepID=A0ABY3V0Q1_MYCLN|nr:secretion protein EspB [Mycobacterium lentiflavum]MEE3067152.1 secretion protein EspB [Actinomycetota bacterium]ULP43514.1 secretion protein EspB [Mycobacterium lentiflavum]
MTSTLTVDYDELMQRADEVEAPVPGLPTENAQAPCLLRMAISATEQIGLSADNMRTFLRTGIEREWPKLADTIRQVAKAYEEVDESAATALDNETSVSAASYSFAAQELDQVVLTTTQAAQSFPPEYQDLKERAWQVEQTDLGASLDNFAAAWTAYQRTLLETVDRFRPFDTYDGEAAYALEQEMEQQRQWVYQMADLCQTMIAQAQTLASTQRWALSEHILDDYKLITYSYLVEFEAMYEKYPEYRDDYMQYYVKWQEKSDEVMEEYQNKAAMPLSPVNPATPPYVRAPSDSGGGGGLPSGNPSGNKPTDALPTDPGGGHGGTGAAAANAADTPTDETPANLPAYPGVVPPLSAGPGVKPASVSGGGMPAMPLQPPIQPDGVPRPTGAAPGTGVFGMGAGGRGAMGGGGGGMPMGGHGGQNQNEKKAKRVQQEDEVLYTEDRQWTAPVIGNRRRNDLPDGGEAPMPAAS